MPEDSGAMVVLRARKIAPLTGPIIDNGAIAIEAGRILAVGKAVDMPIGRSIVLDQGDCVLLPGLVNSHTHLELTNVPRPASTRGLIPWLLEIMSAGARQGDPEPAVMAGVEQSLSFGVTCVGDITRNPQVVRRSLKKRNYPSVSFGEVTAMAGRRGLLDERVSAAIENIGSSDNDPVHLGISPHAPYSIERAGYARCLAEATSLRIALTTHLAESAEEGKFLSEQTGPFRELWEKIGGWDEAVPRFAGGPIRYARHLGLLDYPTLLAHVNYCDDAELAILSKGMASVAYCPRTHAYFRHPPHRWREMLAVGINVAIGTDSAASSGDLNLLDELRLLHQLAPEMPARRLWEMATLNGARALMLADQIGSLESGKWADAIAFDATGADPLREILESNARPRQVWIAGQPMLTGN